MRVLIQVRQLEKIFAGRSVLAIESLDVAAGDVLAVTGLPGSGKTVLVALLAGLLPPSRGSICRVAPPAGAPPGGPVPTGLMFAEDSLYDRLSVERNLAFYCRLHGLPTAAGAAMLVQVGLRDQAQQPARTLPPSGRRRLAFARALLGQPPLLLLDQPALRADLPTQDLMAQLIRDAAAAGAAVILTDGDVAWAGKCCTRVLELQDGRVANLYAFAHPAAGGSAPEQFTPFRVPARSEDRILLYDPGTILYLTSRDGRTYLRTANDEAVTQFTLQELEAALIGRGFFKAHRAYLVNLQHVKAVVPFTRDSFTLLLDDPAETAIPLSKQAEKALQELLGY